MTPALIHDFEYYKQMRLLAISLFGLLSLAAQQLPAEGARRTPPTPKNLKILQPDQVMPAMQAFRAALGVRCTFCHVEGNFASDDNPKKETARKMLTMTPDHSNGLKLVFTR